MWRAITSVDDDRGRLTVCFSSSSVPAALADASHRFAAGRGLPHFELYVVVQQFLFPSSFNGRGHKCRRLN